MSLSNQVQPPQRTCNYCKASKKKCDKLLPSCSRCLRLSIDCFYPAADKPETSEVNQDSQNAKFDEVFRRLEKLEAHILTTSSAPEETNSVQHTHDGSSTVLSDAPQSDEWKVNPGLLKPKALAFLLASSVSRALHESHTTARTVFDKYFSHTHPWLPLISPQTMAKAQRDFELFLPEQGLSLILLAAHLVVTPLSEYPGGISDPDSEWYRCAKYHFGQYVALVEPSLALAQTGILLALFEHTQCLGDRAHVTLGVASRVLFALEIEDIITTVMNRESRDVTREEEEVVLTWWSIILMERYLNMPPLEIPKKAIIDQDSLQLEFLDALPMLPPALQAFENLQSGTLRDLLRELESANLLGKVQAFIRKYRRADITHLSDEIQGLLQETDALVARHIATQMEVGWSAGVAVALSAGLQLQCFRVHKQVIPDYDAHLSLQSYIEQLKDVCMRCKMINGFTEGYMEGLPPSWFSVCFQALDAWMLIKTTLDPRNPAMERDVVVIKGFLEGMGGRYRFADYCLRLCAEA